MGFWLVALFAAAIVSLVALRQVSKKRALADRRPVPLEEIHALLNGALTFDILNEVWTRLGASYSIDPRLIRPNDPISLFKRIDSWALWKGTDAIDEWLRGLDLSELPARQPETVYDLAAWIQSARPGASALTDQGD